MSTNDTSSPSHHEPIVIIGAGVFGLSAALELKHRGYKSVTVLDRYLPPVVDGSSVDISRVIRVDYADPLYGKMAREAYQGWTTEYKDYYWKSGFVMLANQSGNDYLAKAKKISESQGQQMLEYEQAKQVLAKYPSIPSNLDGLKAYVNEAGGWADAEASIRYLSTKCSLEGVSFITGARGRAISLRIERKRLTGINVAEGEPIPASQVFLCAGAWSNRLIPISQATTASGQPVGFIEISPEEAEPLRNMPVLINLSTGVFCFPPTPGTNILKVARHGYGFGTSVPVDEDGHPRIVSSPKRDGNNAAESYLPDDAEEALREGLRQLLPAFADRPWMNRRLCWYSDTPEGDFVIDHHPGVGGVFLATAGAGQ